MFDHEYDDISDAESDDSNAKEYDYPSEEESADGFSDDSSEAEAQRHGKRLQC
jgi:hypothetical protein